ncbi:acyl carrier protein [Streptomyces yaizuensis]|uniref:Acyl carrier protein n=1 Tax=Streptomyces yaizuensis TaxID=2989713 RepID=A0ABQ5NXP4_9ACTN|nr:phosphopantetheine-binding protein [Streptomyces sp. YSPA8]GLF95131.1 acyl carrier protein [Streptomyces sp. YSPA8]
MADTETPDGILHQLHHLMDDEFEWHGAVSIGRDTRIADLPGADSLGYLRVVIKAGEIFGVVLGSDELFDARTVGALCRLIDGKRRDAV